MRRLSPYLWLLYVVLWTLAPGRALAANEDAAVASGIQDVLNDDYAQASYSEAKRKLNTLLDKCNKKVKCSPATRALADVALGMVASQIGMGDEAKNYFKQALGEDSSVKLPSSGTSPSIRAQFAEMQKELAAQAPPPPSDPDTAAAPQPGAGGGAIPGWSSAEAFQLAGAGLAADRAGKLDECIEKDKASLKLEEQPRTRLHLASCESRTGKLIDALKDLQEAYKIAKEKKDSAVLQITAKRNNEILQRLPKVTFVPPTGVSELKVTFDDRPVPNDKLEKKFPIDPGKHTVHADGTANGAPLVFDEDFVVKEGELHQARITLTPRSTGFLTAGQLKCMLAAKAQEEINKCLPETTKNLVVRSTLYNSGYTDTTHVHVYSPEFTLNVHSPTAGWDVGGSFLVDFVSAASPDIVSEASRAYKEQRYAGSLNAGFHPGIFGLSAFGNLSSEPDYVSLTAGGAVTADLNDKLITPRIGYSHSDDTITRQSSPAENWKRKFSVNTFDVGLTFVLSPKTVLQVGGTFIAERGDQSKPYRFVPMFPGSVVPYVYAGVPVDVVNKVRLAFRPVEQLPTERDRYALAARILMRMGSATLRLEERLYRDSWTQIASTTDVRYMMDLGRYLRVWPHGRFNIQTGANFYHIAYEAKVNGTGDIVVPLYRTGDRELSPMLTGTVGGGARIGLTGPENQTQLAIVLSADMMYSYFFKSLFVKSRIASYATMGLEAEFQ